MPLPSWAIPGQQVVCVDDQFPLVAFQLMEIPKLQKTYTIKEAVPCQRPAFCDCTGALIFHEFSAVRDDAGNDWWPIFPTTHFQPVIQKAEELDIAMFKRIADHARIDQLAEEINQ